MLNPFPVKPSATATDTAHTFGCALLLYILQSATADRPCDVYGFLSDDELELVDHVAPVAVAHHDVSIVTVELITTIRHRIAAVLKTRKSERDAVTVPACTPDDTRTGTATAPLKPSPLTNPPAPAMVRAIPDVRF